jgi:hypothetical protein
MTRALAIVIAGAVLGLPALAWAHDGHPHPHMGTVEAVDRTRIELKTVDEKTKEEKVLSILLTDKTRFLRGRQRASLADVKPGERVVVMAQSERDEEGGRKLVAHEVRLAPAAEASGKAGP